ncbi:MAG: OsmC family protein [Bacteroidia bacterium]|nr:OsmC family protein [Bacteroidia bacterium]
MESEHFYEVSVNWKADRIGTLSSPVLETTIEVATPPQFSKGIEGVWSPEHLFVGAVNSCLMTTFLSFAENSNLHFENFSSKSVGKLEMVEGKYMISEITLMPIVTITEKASEEKAKRILKKLENNCLISNSIKSKISFKTEVKIKS